MSSEGNGEERFRQALRRLRRRGPNLPAFLAGVSRAGPWLFRLLALLAVGAVAKWLGLDSDIAALLDLVLR